MSGGGGGFRAAGDSTLSFAAAVPAAPLSRPLNPRSGDAILPTRAFALPPAMAVSLAVAVASWSLLHAATAGGEVHPATPAAAGEFAAAAAADADGDDDDVSDGVAGNATPGVQARIVSTTPSSVGMPSSPSTPCGGRHWFARASLKERSREAVSRDLARVS